MPTSAILATPSSLSSTLGDLRSLCIIGGRLHQQHRYISCILKRGRDRGRGGEQGGVEGGQTKGGMGAAQMYILHLGDRENREGGGVGCGSWGVRGRGVKRGCKCSQKTMPGCLVVMLHLSHLVRSPYLFAVAECLVDACCHNSAMLLHRLLDVQSSSTDKWLKHAGRI